MRKDEVSLNKPIYTGQAILDLSKRHMYRFHFGLTKKLYPGKQSELLMTDTDSLIYEIKTEDIYEDLWEHKKYFDFSDYPEDSKYHDSTNKKVVGKFKDESSGRIIKEFIGIKSKMYCIMMDDDSLEHVKAKGIKKYVIKKTGC